ncbi:MAG: PEP-CTERM sorting domain-containing protein [Acidobacteriia bacterium]|nr:PEP-CTERM sorting domain-containing protein [Terriglobia bacterium]
MISKKLVLLLSLCVAGSMVPAQGAACVSGSSLSTYIGSSCDIGSLTFSFLGFSVIGSTSSTTPVGGLDAAHVTITTLINANGTGFLLTPTVAWTAIGGGSNTDSELKYVVTGTGITSNYLEVDGSATPGGFAHVLEDYCLGGSVGGGNISSTPGAGLNAPCNGPGNGNPGPVIAFDTRITGAGTCSQGSVVSPTGGGPTACGATKTFAAQTSIAVLKDIDINGGDGSGTNPQARINGVINQFGAVPEPGTYLLSAFGLGLLFLGKRKFSRS